MLDHSVTCTTYNEVEIWALAKDCLLTLLTFDKDLFVSYKTKLLVLYNTYVYIFDFHRKLAT
jgi:hypothetical protein